MSAAPYPIFKQKYYLCTENQIHNFNGQRYEDYILPQRTQSLRKVHKENPVNLLIMQIVVQDNFLHRLLRLSVLRVNPEVMHRQRLMPL
jgi:hypothetical protein